MSTAVVVGNPKPASRTLAAATHVARELSGAEPDLVVDLATVGPALLDLGDDGRRRPGRAGGCGRPGGRRQPDLQGDLHGPAQALPRPVRGRHRPLGCRGAADAGRRTRPRARARAAPAAAAHRARRRRAGAQPLRARLRPRRPRRLRRLARGEPPVVQRLVRSTPRDAHRALGPQHQPGPRPRPAARGLRRLPDRRRRGRRRGPGRRHRPGGQQLHLRQPGAAAGVGEPRPHLEDLARAPAGAAPRGDRPRRAARRPVPPAGRAGRAPLRRHRALLHRARRRHPRRGAGPVRVLDLPRGRGRRPRARCCCGCTPYAMPSRTRPATRWSSTAAGSGAWSGRPPDPDSLAR